MKPASVVRVRFSDPPAAVDCHPSQNAICAGCIGGTVEFYTWRPSSSEDAFIELVDGWKSTAEDEQEHVRAVAFLKCGEKLVSASTACNLTIYDIGEGKVLAQGAGGEALADSEDGFYCVASMDTQLLAAGTSQCQRILTPARTS
jgi:hypothetical protein